VVQLVSPCCKATADYQYATWHSCRACGRWFEPPAPRAKVSVMALRSTFSFDVYPARAHVSGLYVHRHDAEQVPLL